MLTHHVTDFNGSDTFRKIFSHLQANYYICHTTIRLLADFS